MRLVRQSADLGPAIKDLAGVIKFVYHSPWVAEKVEYRLMIYPASDPAGRLCRYDLRDACARFRSVHLAAASRGLACSLITSARPRRSWVLIPNRCESALVVLMRSPASAEI